MDDAVYVHPEGYLVRFVQVVPLEKCTLDPGVLRALELKLLVELDTVETVVVIKSPDLGSFECQWIRRRLLRG